jgi:putative transposase
MSIRRCQARVVRVLEQLATERGVPDEIVLDNGPNLAGEAMDQWADERVVCLRFIELSKPNRNAFARFQG